MLFLGNTLVPQEKPAEGMINSSPNTTKNNSDGPGNDDTERVPESYML